MKTTIGILAPRMTEEESRSISLDFVLRLKKTHRQLTLNCLHDLLRDPEAAAVPPGYSYEEHSIPAAAFYLTGLLRAHGYDTVMDYRWDTAALERMAKASPRAVCVSTTMLLHRRSLENVVASIRTFMPDALIVVGGILVWKSYTWLETISAHPEIAAGMPEDEVGRWAVFPCWRPELDADVIVAAPHGGPTLIRILDEIEKGNRAGLEDIPNLALPGTSGEFHFTARADEGIDHDTNFTRWDLLDALPVRVPVTTSVGCPHRCGFCDFCRMYPKLVFRSRQSLLAEFTMIRDLLPRNPGTFLLQFTDDNAFANAPRIEEVCHALLDSKLELFWASLMRVSSITEANVDLVKRSGLVLAMTGVESGDPGQLKRMNKALNLDKLRAGIELLDRNHIPVAMSLVMGYPGETKETLANTAAFLNSLSVSTVQYHVYPLWVSPVSELAMPEVREKWGLKGFLNSWSHGTMNSDQVVDYAYWLFKEVPEMPYNYYEESSLFNMRFGPEGRRKLFRMRWCLTTLLMENAPWEAVADTLADIAEAMGFGRKTPSPAFRGELLVPKLQLRNVLPDT